MMRFILALLFTTLPVASAMAETWTSVGSPIQPKKKFDPQLRFDNGEIRGHGKGCSALACQVALPGWKRRTGWAERYYKQCLTAILSAHAGTEDWNVRDIRTTREDSWLVRPTRKKPTGVHFRCLKQPKRQRTKVQLPPVSVAPHTGRGAAVVDLGARRAKAPPPVEEIKVPPTPEPRPMAKPKPAASATVASSRPAEAQAKPAENPVSARLLRGTVSLCAGTRLDFSSSEFGPVGCVTGGGELRWSILLVGVEIELNTSFGGEETLSLGGRGHISLVFDWFEVGPYGRLTLNLIGHDGLPPLRLFDWGLRLGFNVVDNESWGMNLVFNLSAGSRLMRSGYDVPERNGSITEHDTLGVGGNTQIVVRLPIP